MKISSQKARFSLVLQWVWTEMKRGRGGVVVVSRYVATTSVDMSTTWFTNVFLSAFSSTQVVGQQRLTYYYYLLDRRNRDIESLHARGNAVFNIIFLKIIILVSNYLYIYGSLNPDFSVQSRFFSVNSCAATGCGDKNWPTPPITVCPPPKENAVKCLPAKDLRETGLWTETWTPPCPTGVRMLERGVRIQPAVRAGVFFNCC